MRPSRRGWWTKGTIAAGVLTLLGTAFVLPSGSAGAATPSGTPIKIGYIQEQAAGPSSINEEPVLPYGQSGSTPTVGSPVTRSRSSSTWSRTTSRSPITQVQKLISEGVVAIVDADANDSAWAQYTENAGVPVLLSTNTLAFGSTDDAVGTAGGPIVEAMRG